MKKKLLHITLRANLIFSVVVLVITAPLFYFIIQKLYLDETDESLLIKKNEFVKLFNRNFDKADIPHLNTLNQNLKIIKTNKNEFKDSFFYGTFYDSIAMENEYCRVLQAPLNIEGESYLLEAKISLVENEDLVSNIGWLFLGTLLILLIGFYIITKVYSNKVWQPFYATLHQIENFEIDKDIIPQFKNEKIDEFNRLNSAILHLIERNTAIFNSQREFVENAAHELQTPLAIFQAKIDNLIQNADLTVAQSEILIQLYEALARLNKLNKNLLLLSKIESNQYNEIERVDMVEILNKQIPFFEEQANSKSILLKIHSCESLQLQTNSILAELLINNLFLNAVRHNIVNGVIEVEVNENKIVFSNTGINQALDADKLFQRFAKQNPSSIGNGLGLAIIERICIINNWKVNYRFENNLHIFEISL